MDPLSAESSLAPGERVLLVDPKNRRYLIRLEPGGIFHTHSGLVSHDSIIGELEGTSIAGSTGRRFLALRPTLSDTVLKMPRGAQVIYPKDLGSILIAANITDGKRVLEAGVGSGALSMALVQAGASVIGYEIRADFARTAKQNVAEVFGDEADYEVLIKDVTQGIDESGLDGVILDLPEPWKVVGHASRALRSGGIFVAYLPTINQTATLRAALDKGSFCVAETFETLRRSWHIEDRSVRPDHRMVAHTGFVTSARKAAKGC